MSARQYVTKIFLFTVFYFTLLQSTAISGTVDNATFSPSNSKIAAGTSQEITFSAINDKSFALKDYHIKIKYDDGLSATGLAVSPSATKAEIYSKRNLIEIKWENIPSGTELKATFNVSSNTVGTYNIAPWRIIYLDYDHNRYYGTSNTPTITVKAELNPPSAPRNIKSTSGEGAINIYWSAPSDPDVASYNIYKRTSTSNYSKLNVSPIYGTSYSDADIQDGMTYHYTATAVDTSDNESGYSIETGETYFNLTIKSYNSVASIAAVGDINGDGKPDIVFGYPSVAIYYGGNTSGIPDVSLSGENSDDKFGYSLAVVDLNKDGFDDLVIGAPFHDPYLYSPVEGTAFEAGKIYVYAGGAQFSTTPVLTIKGKWSIGGGGYTYYPWWSENLGFSIAAAGDINKDGYQDVVIGAPYGGMSRSGRILILFGGTNLSGLGSTEYSGPNSWELMGYSVSSAGDVNGDGYSDVLAGGPSDYSNDNHYGRAYLFNGGSYLQLSRTFSTGIADDGFGARVSSAGDINGDGYSDIGIGRKYSYCFSSTTTCVSVPAVDIFYGGTSSNTPDITLINSEDSYQGMGIFLLPMGNINNDGYDDFLTGTRLRVYFGSSYGENVPDITKAGITVLGAGDTDGDNLKEVIVTDSSKTRVYSVIPYLSLPEITIFSPKNNVTTNIPYIKGAVKGNVAKLQVGGQQVSLMPDGTFSATVSLSAGDNIFEIIAETPEGKISKRILTITYGQPAPLTLSITSPAAGAVLNNTPITVTGTVSDPTASVTVNGVQATLSGNTFTASINLTEGLNTITAVATDSYGQTASQSITVTLITKGTITGTVTDSSMGLPLSNVTITVTDSLKTQTTITDSYGTYTISGAAQGSITATIEKTGYIKQTISDTLTVGQTLILNVQLTPIPPLAITITSPLDGAVLNSSPITVTGNVSNNAHVTVNGIQASVSNNTFSASVLLTERQNAITATAVDQYNQTASHSINVTLTTKGSITGTVTDSSGLSLSSANVTVTDSSNNTQTALTASDGTYTISSIPSGTFTISITKTGYTTYNFSDTISGGQTIIINAALSPIPPTISNIAISNITTNSATITWTTDQPSDSLIQYGTTTSYGSSATDSTLTTSHSITLTNLASSTTYHFKVTSTNSYGFSTTSGDNTFTTSSPPSSITLTITSPLNGETINKSDVIVKGTVSNTTGNETGVTVNGIIATVDGNKFVANHVPLQEGANTITATAKDITGNTTTASITVNANTTGNYIKIISNIESGIVPLEVTLKIDGSFSFTHSSLLVTGPVQPEVLYTGIDEYKLRMTVEGTYYFEVSITGSDGNVYKDTVAVTVLNKTQLDTLLKNKWEGMKTALISGDIEKSLAYFVEGSKGRYRAIFVGLTPEQTNSIFSNIIDIKSESVNERAIECGAIRTEIDGTYSYPVTFVKDENGMWMMMGF